MVSGLVLKSAIKSQNVFYLLFRYLDICVESVTTEHKLLS